MPRPASQPSRQAKVDGYTLALSWSPEYCRGRIAQPADRLQCSRAAGEFGFVITGLWPDAQRGAAPTWCTSSNRRLDAALVKKHFCAFASPERMERAWRRHGACTAMPPARYFAAATRAFAALAIPDMERLSRQPLTHERLIQA